MTYPHAIRLGEPWQRSAQGGFERYQRSFNCPTGLTHETVWLVLEDAPAGVSVMVNGHAPGESSCHGTFVEFDLTTLLAPRNTIQIDVPTNAAQPASQVLGPVKLEIRAGQRGCS